MTTCPADRCAWGGCLPGRCTAAESAGSPNCARFAPRQDGPQDAGNIWREWLVRTLRDGPEVAAGLLVLAGLGIVLARIAIFWGGM